MKPVVSIIMGSDSDLPVMKDAAEFLESFGVTYEITVVSAHRTADKMVDYARTAKKRGIKIIIAGAGGAAHLPGMVAAITPLPVIGVPIKTKSLNGIDSLLSIAQMPPGVPVSTVAINGAKNAGIIACQILSLNSAILARKMDSFKKEMEAGVLDKGRSLKKKGFKKYLEQSKK